MKSTKYLHFSQHKFCSNHLVVFFSNKSAAFSNPKQAYTTHRMVLVKNGPKSISRSYSTVQNFARDFDIKFAAFSAT